MTIEEFADKHNKKIEKVLLWIYEGDIPNASIDKDFVPNSARVPYKSKAKKADAIYLGIVKASVNLQHVSPKTFGLCNEEFDVYINGLEKAGYITKRATDGVTYYDATVETCDIDRKKIMEAIKAVSCGVSLGVTTAILNK